MTACATVCANSLLAPNCTLSLSRTEVLILHFSAHISPGKSDSQFGQHEVHLIFNESARSLPQRRVISLCLGFVTRIKLFLAKSGHLILRAPI